MIAAYIFALLLARLLAYVAIRVHCYLSAVDECEFPLRHWFASMLVPIMSIVVCLGVLIAVGEYLTMHPLALILVIAGITGINMLAFILYDELSAKSKRLVDNERTRNRLESDLRQYGSVVSHIKEFSALLHDSRKHRETVHGLLASGDTAAALKYLDGLLASSAQLYGKAILEENPAVDALLRRKIAEAVGHGIKVICNCDMGRVMPIDEVSLCLIFGNALDNAIEACRRLPEGYERRIEIDVQYMDDRLSIRIQNTSGYVRIANNSPVTARKESTLHGHGLPNIKKTVEKNGGHSVIRYENGLFVLSIVFLL